MQPDSAFNKLVEAAQVSTNDLAIIAGVTPRAAQLWRAGKQNPPQSLILLLLLITDEIATLPWLGFSIGQWKTFEKENKLPLPNTTKL